MKRLLEFMNKQNVKEMNLTHYMSIQQKKGQWSKDKARSLWRGISKTDELQAFYIQSESIETIVRKNES